MKKSIFDEQTSKALKKWHKAAVKRKQGLKLGKSSVRSIDGSTPDSTIHSSGPTLHRYKTVGHSARTTSAYGDQDDYQSDIELSPTSNLIVRVDQIEQDAKESEHQNVEETNEQQPIISEGSFKFVNLDSPERSAK